MINKIIILLLCWKLGLKRNEMFQFTNQKSPHDTYYFTRTCLRKIEYDENDNWESRLSNVSLNWLLSSACEIKKVEA